MNSQLLTIFFIVMAFLCLTIYAVRAFFYNCGTLEVKRGNRIDLIAVVLIQYFLLFMAIFLDFPVVLEFIVIYLLVLLQFFLLFHGTLAMFLFSAGIFLFHVMNLKMAVTSIYILIFQIPSFEEFKESHLYVSSIFVTLLLLQTFLEVFQKALDRQSMQLLIHNYSQLLFVSTSQGLINIYLIILSVSYNGQAYSTLAAIFLLSTSFLLFGAFYTFFLHAVKMSVLLEYEVKSKHLEQQLKDTYKDMETLQSFAFTDALTEVHNRRYGMGQLERLVKAHIPFCLCYLDIDHLKYVNDVFGHNEGDQYILSVVKKLSLAFRKSDFLSRMGGDEFMVLMPETSYRQALSMAETAYREVRRLPFIYHPSISYGIYEAGGSEEISIPEILKEADRSMYQFKKAQKTEWDDKPRRGA